MLACSSSLPFHWKLLHCLLALVTANTGLLAFRSAVSAHTNLHTTPTALTELANCTRFYSSVVISETFWPSARVESSRAGEKSRSFWIPNVEQVNKYLNCNHGIPGCVLENFVHGFRQSVDTKYGIMYIWPYLYFSCSPQSSVAMILQLICRL